MATAGRHVGGEDRDVAVGAKVGPNCGSTPGQGAMAFDPSIHAEQFRDANAQIARSEPRRATLLHDVAYQARKLCQGLAASKRCVGAGRAYAVHGGAFLAEQARPDVRAADIDPETAPFATRTARLLARSRPRPSHRFTA